MANKPQLIIVMSGKKQSGKTTSAKAVLATFINQTISKERFVVDQAGDLIDTFTNDTISIDYETDKLTAIKNTFNIGIYSFADPLKHICIDVLGLDYDHCYGSNQQKDRVTHIEWTSMPLDIQAKYHKTGGKMSGREIMQVFGTDMFRKADENCFARGLYNRIVKDNKALSIVTDARFPNEVTIGTEIGAKVIRLLREPFASDHDSEIALDDFPRGEYSFVLENSNMDMAAKNSVISGLTIMWAKERGLV